MGNAVGGGGLGAVILAVVQKMMGRALTAQDLFHAVLRLEQEVAAMNANLPPLESFILPGGTPSAAHAHLARTVTRRAERRVVTLASGTTLNPMILLYLNRLSDYLFVLGRVLNNNAADDVLWVPGLGR